MHDDLIPAEPGSDDLVLKAMLYASGELDAQETAAFEQRLGEDQTARDALCHAVELTQTFGNAVPRGPDPEYRSRVRHRLRQRRRHRKGLSVSHGPFFSSPAFWSVLGAAVAVLLMVILSHIVATHEFEQLPQPGGEEPDRATLEQPVTPDMAKTWADLHNSDHLQKARTDEMRRKLRAAITAKEAPRDGDIE